MDHDIIYAGKLDDGSGVVMRLVAEKHLDNLAPIALTVRSGPFLFESYLTEDTVHELVKALNRTLTHSAHRRKARELA